MKNNDHFSEQVLEQTLLAVRHKRRCRNQRRAGFILCLLLATLAVWFRPASHDGSDHQAQASVPDQNNGKEDVVVFGTASANVSESTFTTFSTRDSAVEVKRISTKEMSAMLGKIPHGFYKTVDGETHFWSPTLARLN